MSRNANKKCLRYVYMLEVDNRGNNSKYYGHKNIYYTGQTSDIRRRVLEHLAGRNSKFLKRCFPNSKKIPLYVEYIFGTEYKAMGREIEIKKKSRKYKQKLIKSEKNALVRYIPCKAIILKKYKQPEQKIAIKL